METVGLILDAQGGDKYLNTLGQVAAAETKVASAADPAVAGINKLDDSATRAAPSLDELGDEAKKGGKGLNALEQAAIGAARKVGELVVNAAGEAAEAVLQFVGDTIGAAGDFENGMNRFASVTGDALADSGQSLEEFKNLFISLGRELPVSTAEVQQAAIEMAKGGIEPATIAAGGLRDVLDLAAAGEVGIAEAAEIASKQLGVWVDSAADASTKAAFLKDSVNLLSQAANASTVDVDDLALGLANTGKSADLAGLSFRETVTSMALISSGFSSAADAGTSFKTFLTRLQPATDSQSEAFKRLNLLTAEGSSVFYDATGSFIGMDKAAQILQDSLEGMSEAQKSAALNAAFGSDAIRAAGMLADAGAEGYRAMAEQMAKAGSAAVQAARKQKGFNVAVDNMMGSIEAFQITVGSAFLPVLTKIVNVLASGVNAITEYAEATIAGETALAKIAGVIQTAAIPALTGVTAALTAYAAVQVLTAAPATVALIAKVNLATTAFIANAAATMAALAPYALIAAAVGGVVLAYQNFTSKVSDATTQLLESRQWWHDSAAAIEDHSAQVGEAKEALEPYAATIGILREQIQAEIEDLGKRDAAGMVSDEQRQSEMDHINLLRKNLISVTKSYNDEAQAIIDTTAASLTATSQAANLEQAEFDLGEQSSLTAKDIEKLDKAIQKTFADGQQSIQDYASTYSEFSSAVEDRAEEHADQIAKLEAEKQKATSDEQRKGIDEQIKQVKQNYAEQEKAAALSYAAQQTAQRAHLGQMLIDYTVSQAMLGNISKQKAAEITAALEREYGLQESSTATTFLNMAQSVDAFAADTGASIDSLIGDLNDQEQAAKDTQKAMDDYAKEYTATQVNNFLEGKTDAEEYIASLERIPTNITTTVTVREVTQKGGEASGDLVEPTHRAVGGPIEAGQSYLVGEKGPEIITPSSSGYVTPNDAVQRAMPSMAQLGALFGGQQAGNVTYISVDARGSSLTMADVTMAVQAGLAAEGRDADVRIRTGAF